MTFRLPRRALATAALGVAALAGVGVAAAARADSGSVLPVLGLQTAPVDELVTTTTAKLGDAASTAKPDDATTGCDHDGKGRGDRAPLDDATAAKVRSAALEAVPNATVDRVGHDHRDDGYVARLTKADGTTRVLVREDADFTVTKVEDPAPARPARGHRGDHGRRDAEASTTAKQSGSAS